MTPSRARYLLLALLFMLVCLPASSTTRRLKIIHWNDLHAQLEPFSVKTKDTVHAVGGYAYFKAVVDSLRTVARANDEACIALDGGDNFQGTLVSSITRGRAMYELLNTLKPDAVAIGNHEFDYGWKNLDSLFHHVVRFPTVCANILDEHLTTVTSSSTIRYVEGMRVVIIGLTTDALTGTTLPENITGLTVKHYDEVLPGLLREARKQKPTLIVLLTHVGVESDSVLAARYPEINVIVGGHSHTPLFKPMHVGRTIIVQAGSRGRWVGELDLDVDTDGDSVFMSSGKLIEVEPDRIIPESAAVADVARLLKLVDSSYAEVIGALKHDWKADQELNGSISTFEATAIRSAFSADIGCMNLGGIRKSLLAGPILLKDVYEINPFRNELVRIAISGAHLRSALETMLRGDASELCDFAGIRCIFDRAQNKLESALIDGKEMTENATYTLITNAFVASKLRAIFGLKPHEAEVEHLGVIEADVIAAEIRKRTLIDGRSVQWVSFRN